MNRVLRLWVTSLVCCVIATPVAIGAIDRPVAQYLSEHFVGSQAARALELPLRILRPIVFLAFVGLLTFGVRGASGRALSTRVREFTVCATALVLSIGAEYILKQLFGRGDPYPTYLVQHQYGFDWWHAHDGYWSFPSGTAMGVFAIVGVLFVWRSRWIVGATVLAAAICVAVTILNFHWVSDTVAGVFIGLTIGFASAWLVPIGETRSMSPILSE